MSQNQNDLPPVDGVPEKSALCFRGICSCNRPPVSAQWRCSCWAVSASRSPCSAESWCLLGSAHISQYKYYWCARALFEIFTEKAFANAMTEIILLAIKCPGSALYCAVEKTQWCKNQDKINKKPGQWSHTMDSPSTRVLYIGPSFAWKNPFFKDSDQIFPQGLSAQASPEIKQILFKDSDQILPQGLVWNKFSWFGSEKSFCKWGVSLVLELLLGNKVCSTLRPALVGFRFDQHW